MKKKYLIQLLSLLCAVCFTAGGATLFAASISDEPAVPVVLNVSSENSYETLKASVSSKSSKAKKTSSAKASSKEPKTSSENVSSAVSSAKAVTSKPNDYISELNDKSQDIPHSMKSGSSSSEESSKASSKSASSKKTSSKTSSGTSSKKSASSGSVSSKVTSSGESGGGDVIYLSVGGEVKEYSVLDAVAQNVAAEMDDYFEDEAIKAQAVAAHTYMVYTNSCGKAPVLPLRTPSANIKSLVKSVIGKLIYYNSKPINAVYFATSGGDTASAKDIWGSEIAYLKSVPSKYDNLVKGYKTTKTYSADDFKSIIKKNAGISLTGSAESWLKILSFGDGGYVGNMSLGGKKKATINGSSRTITGNLFRESILSYGIRSPKFEFSLSDDASSITFTTYGYGHCVGMSQNGANMYAKKDGRGYSWILKHYYTGVTIK